MEKTFEVRVQPRASREKVEALGPGYLKVYTRRPALDGEANKAVVEMLAMHFNVKRNCVSIMKGLKSRNKTVRIKTMR